MARIRRIEITHFRSIRSFEWLPGPGINCLVGPGDSGKSTILDAIDLCLGARRTAQFTDADFYNLDFETPISITVTFGELDDALKNIEVYGLYLRGFNSSNGEIEDEPNTELETVLTLNLSVGSDLEPVWTLVSDRARAQDSKRNLTWGDRVQLAPTRIGMLTDYNLGWRRGSVLNRLTDEKADASAALAKAARDARAAFGEDAEMQLGETLRLVATAAKQLGIDIGAKARALLDAHSVTFGGGTISLHNEDGVPLRGLGIGSTRLLIAGLQRQAAGRSPLLLVDELEHGLEPHRIIRFLSSLGAKEKLPPLQVFVTTHSPVALRELNASQLTILREKSGKHYVLPVGTQDDAQGAIRLYPEAFLARCVVICEGASEVGLIRGIDEFQSRSGMASISACGVALVDGRGVSKLLSLASVFASLGYRTSIIRDDDVKPDSAQEAAYCESGGGVFMWRDGRALEDELFLSLPTTGITQLVEKAVVLHGEDLINEHLKSKSSNLTDLSRARAEVIGGNVSNELRAFLGKAARTNSAPWFKNVATMEEIGRDIVGPCLLSSDKGFRGIVERTFTWLRDA